MILDPASPALASLSTPALVVDRESLVNNISAMAARAGAAGIALRPHAKTHKCVEIARLQMDAGAIGIACATLLELEHMAAAGLGGLLLTAPQAGEDRAERVAALNRRTPIMVTLDHPVQARELAAAVRPGDPDLGVLIDVDVGQKRTGVVTLAESLLLAGIIAAAPGLTLKGVQGFAGQAQHVIEAEARRALAQQVWESLAAHRDAVRAAGHAADIVTGSGTGTSAFDMQGRFTELQVGSYVFMDADYARLEEDAGNRGPLPYAHALFVLARVVSANRPGQVTVDAGTKALAFNGPPPDRILGAPEGTRYGFAGDEHGILHLPEGSAPLALGSRVLIAATHCDPTANLHAGYHVVSGSGLEFWPIVGRYGDTAPRADL